MEDPPDGCQLVELIRSGGLLVGARDLVIVGVSSSDQHSSLGVWATLQKDHSVRQGKPIL